MVLRDELTRGIIASSPRGLIMGGEEERLQWRTLTLDHDAWEPLPRYRHLSLLLPGLQVDPSFESNGGGGGGGGGDGEVLASFSLVVFGGLGIDRGIEGGGERWLSDLSILTLEQTLTSQSSQSSQPSVGSPLGFKMRWQAPRVVQEDPSIPLPPLPSAR